jgi:predicted nucleic acid-binding protein
VITLVVDSSVAVKWVIPEHDTAQALALRPHRLYAPELLMAECANVFWKKVRRSELTAAEALLAARLLERADINLVSMRNLVEPSAKLAISLDHPAYDCTYLALAEAMDTIFVTADEVLVRRIRAKHANAKVFHLASALAALGDDDGQL